MNIIFSGRRPRAAVALALVLATNSVVAAVGRTVGQADVSITGEAVYSIPIETPPGVKDLTPRLALTYGHRQDEGLAGIGWTVSGLSVIQRCSKTFAQDGTTKGVDLLTSDRLCLDGNQLRRVSGTHGTAGSTYRTELDTVPRITANGEHGEAR
ncbi:MAG TPA: SpvB/TcaC N-terminal domain-containing protein [Woeseiaceae bacterium]